MQSLAYDLGSALPLFGLRLRICDLRARAFGTYSHVDGVWVKQPASQENSERADVRAGKAWGPPKD